MMRLNRLAAIALLLAALPCAAAQEAPTETPRPASPPTWCPAGVNPSAAVPKELMNDGQVERTPPRPGDNCIVCNRPLEAIDMAYEVRGQRVPVHVQGCDEALRAHPQKYLALLNPLGGAFLGTDTQQPRPSKVWLIAGLYVLLGLIFGAICAHRSLHTGYSPAWGFLLGFLLNLPGYIYVLTRPKREVVAPAGVPAGLRKISATYAPQPCPKCGAENHPAAVQCLSCGASLTPQVTSEVERVGLRA
jgi:hypothetical protein